MAGNSKARIELPPKLIPVFAPAHGAIRYRGAYGGRGSGKTRTFALMTAVRGYQLGKNGHRGAILCAREFMNSLDDSSLEEVKEAIHSVPWLANYYDVGEKYVRSKDGNIKYIFAGLRHNLDSVKGKTKILIAWIDEAETVSELAWTKLTPTVREEGSEIWVTWNPESEDSATKARFIDSPPANSAIVELNWRDNPWFPETLNEERLNDLNRDPDRYAHIWDGQCLTRSDAQILSGKYEIRPFEPQDDWDGPYIGLDFGFAQDPTACTKSWCHDETLYIEYEAGKIGLETDDIPAFLRERIPAIPDHTVRADSARPETISYLKRNGLPRCIGVRKWSGSVEDGIAHLRSYKRIVIHPRCEETAREARLYSYKVDRLSGDVLPKVIDLNNHYIDSIRYALEPIIGAALGRDKQQKSEKPRKTDAWGNPQRERNAWNTM